MALSETIRVMAEIDEAIEQYGGWPDAFASDATAEHEDGTSAEPPDPFD